MNNYNIVSIAAYDRSGTTFLGALLNKYKDTFYIGEMYQGFKFLNGKHEDLCTCGSKIRDCQIWGEVQKFPGQPIDGKKTKLIYNYLATKTKSTIIIDSSKKVNQIKNPTVHNKENQVLVHLVRNPKGVIYSRMKTTKRLLLKGMHPRPGIAKYTNLLMIIDAFTWCHRNVQLERYKKNRAHVTVIYEDLETAYEDKILPFLIERVGLNTDFDKTSVPHILGGNINRYDGINDIRIDYSWRKGLSFFQKAIVDFITFPVRKFYGYKF